MKKWLIIIVSIIAVLIAGGFIVKNNEGDSIFYGAYKRIVQGPRKAKRSIDPRIKRRFDDLKGQLAEMRKAFEESKSYDEAKKKEVVRDLVKKCFDLSMQCESFHGEVKNLKADDFDPQDIKKLNEEIVEFSKEIKKK